MSASRAGCRPVHHRLLRSRTPGNEPAVANPDGVQPEDQLHVDVRASVDEDRIRVPAHPDRSAGRQSALRPRQYAGKLSRPAGAAANNLYNLADFMLGLRSTYALSNILVANLRQNMHFAYVQDDVRFNDRLTLNLGLRYEYATPHWEKDNILTNFDPGRRVMVPARDGSLEDRTTIKPDRNNFGPRLGLAYTLTPRTVSAAGMASATCTSIAPAAQTSCRSTARRSSTRSSCRPTRWTQFRRTEQGYPAGLTDPSRFDPLAANITYMPRDYHSSRVQSWFASVQRELGQNMMLDLAYVGNAADDMLLFANFNQAAPNNSAGTSPLRPAPDSRLRGHHLLVQRRQVALQCVPGEVRLAHARGAVGAQLADPVEDGGQRRGISREPERQLPRAPGLLQHGRGFRHLGVPSAVQQHNQPCLHCRSAGAAASSPTPHRSWMPSSAAGTSRESIRLPERGHSPIAVAATFRSRVFSRTSAAPTTTGPT